MTIKIVYGNRERAEFGNGFNAKFQGEVKQIFPVDVPGSSLAIESPPEVDVVVRATIGAFHHGDEETLMYWINSDRKTTWWKLVDHLKPMYSTKLADIKKEELPPGVDKLDLAEFRDLENIAKMITAAYTTAGIMQEEVIVYLYYDTNIVQE